MEGLTIAQEALELLKDIPEDKFITDDYTDDKGKCCAIGHYIRLKSANPQDYSYQNCCDCDMTFREHTSKFLNEVHGVGDDISTVNNERTVNGYTQEKIKDRVIALLEDMVEEGY